jgi:hypothetical protein
MKKIQLILATLALIFACEASHAQCTPDPTAMSVGFFPDTFPDGKVDEAYSAVMSAVLPRDTTVRLLGTPITASFCSFSIDTIFLPDGLSYACDQPDCTWAIDHSGVINRGCIAITGTPTEGLVDDSVEVLIKITPGYIDTANNLFCDADSFRQEFDFVWQLVESFLTQQARFKMKIATNTATSPQLEESLQIGIYPNPATDVAQFEYTTQEPRDISIKLIDATGRVLQHVYNGSSLGYQRHEINTASIINPGLYFVHMNIAGEGTITRKLTVQQ